MSMNCQNEEKKKPKSQRFFRWNMPMLAIKCKSSEARYSVRFAHIIVEEAIMRGKKNSREILKIPARYSG